jgi:hypothetical protein
MRNVEMENIFQNNAKSPMGLSLQEGNLRLPLNGQWVLVSTNRSSTSKLANNRNRTNNWYNTSEQFLSRGLGI